MLRIKKSKVGNWNFKFFTFSYIHIYNLRESQAYLAIQAKTFYAFSRKVKDILTQAVKIRFLIVPTH